MGFFLQEKDIMWNPGNNGIFFYKKKISFEILVTMGFFLQEKDIIWNPGNNGIFSTRNRDHVSHDLFFL
jgi:hypothetical protein